MNRTQLKRRARLSYIDTPRLYWTTAVYLLLILLLNYVGTKINSIVVTWMETAIEIFKVGGLPPLATRRELAATLFTFVLNIMIVIVDVGFMSFTLNISRHRPTSMVDLADGFSVTFKVFALAFLQGLFVTLWSILFIIPGIVASYRYRQAYYILLDDPSKGPLQCLRESKQLMKGHKWELFVLDLSFLGWSLLIALSAGILGIWIRPYIDTTYAMYYNMLLWPDGIFPDFTVMYEEQNDKEE